MPDSPLSACASRRPREQTVVVVWPSIAAGAWGQWLGRLYSRRAGVRIAGVPLTVGWLAAGLTAPLAALLYLAGKAPRRPFLLFGPVNADGVRYRVTTDRVLVERPFEKGAAPVAGLSIGGFDQVEIDVLPGQDWFHVGDVVFLLQGEECLRLAGVPRPEPFLQTLLKAQQAWRMNQPETASPAGPLVTTT